MSLSTVLVFNLILYLLMTYRYGKSSKMSLTYIMSIYYVFIATMGIVVIETGIYENVISLRRNEEYSITPYLFCFYCLAVLIYPLKNVSFDNISFKEIPYNKTTSFVINIWIVDMIAYLLLKLSQAVMASAMGYGEMYYMSTVEGDSTNLFYGNNWLLFKFNNFNVNLNNAFSPFVMCYAFYGLITHQIRQKKALLIIGLIFFSQMFSALAIGSRGNLFFTFWSIGFYFIIFYNKFSSKFKRKIILIITSFLALIIVYSLAISFARIGDSSTETPLTNIPRYFGEAFPNLGNVFWGEVKAHPYGARLFPDIFGQAYSAISIQDEYSFWQAFTGVPVLLFKTIYGDLYIEFGEFLPLVIVTVLSFIFIKFIGKRQISFWKMALIYWYFSLILQGVFGFNKGGHSNFIVLIAILIVSFIVKIYTTKIKKA